MHRPKPIGDTGAVLITLSSLHKRVAEDLTQHGEFFYKGKGLMDSFGLANTPQETQEAISNLITVVKLMKRLDCQLMHVGFKEIDRTDLKYCFTYCVQSEHHDNDPLMVNINFDLEVPLLALATETAKIWNFAYGKFPHDDVLRIAEGG